MKFGVVIFPGSNCDHDCYYAIESVIGKACRIHLASGHVGEGI